MLTNLPPAEKYAVYAILAAIALTALTSKLRKEA
jgi:hypothetical protein